jgi:hypothetical protein
MMRMCSSFVPAFPSTFVQLISAWVGPRAELAVQPHPIPPAPHLHELCTEFTPRSVTLSLLLQDQFKHDIICIY